MAETFEEQMTAAARAARDHSSTINVVHSIDRMVAAHVAVAIRANPAPVLALLSDDALEAEMQRRKEKR